MALRISTRTLGAAYLVVGAGTGVGAALGGGAVAVTWALTSGAMGVAWLARTDASVRPDRVRIPRRGFGHRDVPFAAIDHLATPHPLARTPHPRAELRDGTSVVLTGLPAVALAELAAAAGVPVRADPRPAAPPAAPRTAPDRPMDVAREAAAIRARDAELRTQLREVVRRRPGRSA